ncbi:hypothetical protein ABIB38_001480 [Massilia sp. UYP11]|uniref:hypothetical protein n=1 Tax=Massilia sp. UYP11 TaxID=1756385 RepID=UPI003D241299
MVKKLFAAAGSAVAFGNAADSVGLHGPYAEPHVNFMYNLLFCDDLALFKNEDGSGDGGALALSVAETMDEATLLDIARDDGNEGRIRAIAYHRLRMMGAVIPQKELLGVIVEVPLAEGLDVLAAFSEGGVRYLNQSGKVLVIEGGGTPIALRARELISVARPVIDKIGPWEEQRLPPPTSGNIRITFLVSDGLYFGEGPASSLQNDDMAGPVLSKAVQLLQEAIALGSGN